MLLITTRQIFTKLIRLAAVGGLVATAATSAHALSDTQQLLSGGTSMAQASTQYGAPGTANTYGADFPGTGQGKDAAAIRMPAGTLSNLRARLTTATVPASGIFTITILKNGTATGLTCQISATGLCSININVIFANNDRLSVEAKNNFTGSGNMAYNYTMLFD